MEHQPIEETKTLAEGERHTSGDDVEISPAGSDFFIDPDVEKRVLRKIDMFVMPMVRHQSLC
jgi:hypothetical protein